MPTSEDIAKYLGISRGTVSRALNDRGRISEDTRSRVLQAVAELGYEPNRAARALVGAKPTLSAISLFSQPAHFWDIVKEGIRFAVDDLRHFGFAPLLVENRIEEPDRQAVQLTELYERGVRAIAVAPNDPVQLDGVLTRLAAKGVSILTFNVDIPSKNRLCYLGCDYHKAGRLAGDTLARLLPPNATVAAITFSPHVLTVMQRVEGFCEVMRAYPGIRVITEEGYRRDGEGAYERTLAFLRANPGIDGMFVSFGVIEEAAEALITLGLAHRVRLVGYDLSARAEAFIRDGVIDAVICHDPLMQGFSAAKLLYNLTAFGIKPHSEVIYTKLELVVRENLDSHTDERNRLSVLKTHPAE